MVTLQDLDETVSQIKQLADEIRKRMYPNGKPDWMPQKMWDDISWKKTLNQEIGEQNEPLN